MREFSGQLILSHALDMDKSPGSHQGGNPALVYSGATVSPRPVFQRTIDTANNAALPGTIGVELIWDGSSQGTDNYSTTGLAPGDKITVAAQVDSAVSGVGRHTWELRVKRSGQADLVDSGVTYVVNQDASAFGAGWNLSILNRLYSIASDANGPAGQLWVYGDGSWRFFVGASGTLTSPADDNGTLVKNGDGSFTYTTPEQTKIEFNSSGYQTAWVSADTKESLAFGYTSNLLTDFTARDTSTSTLSYSSGLLTSIAVPGSRTFTTTITSGELVAIENPDGGDHTFDYDAAHRLTQEVFVALENHWEYNATTGLLNEHTWGSDSSPSVFEITPQLACGLAQLHKGNPRGIIVSPLAGNPATRYAFDVKGRLLTQLNPDGGKTTFTRDSAGRVLTASVLVDANTTRTTTYTRDAAGYVTREDLPDTNYRTWTYNSTWHVVTQYRDERAKITTFAVDNSNGHVTKVTNALSAETDYGFDATTGLLETITDDLGTVTDITYDGYRRQQTVTVTADSTVQSFVEHAYDAAGHLDTSEDALALVTNYSFDVMGRMTSRQVGSLDAEQWVYNGAGMLSEYTNQNGILSTTDYDVLGRGLVDLTRYAADTADVVTLATMFNDAGQPIQTRDGLGFWTHYALDVMGRVIKTTDAAGNYARHQYNLASEVVASWNEQGGKTAYTINSRGWVTQTVDPRGETMSKGYDAAGNVTTITNALGKIWTNRFDDLGRLDKQTDPTGRFAETTWWEDGRTKDVIVGQTVGLTTTSTTKRHDVNWAAREESITEDYGGSLERTSYKRYNEVGFTIETEDALGHQQFFVPDAYHRLDQVKDHNNVVKANYTRDDAGNITAMLDGLSELTTFGLDSLARRILTTDPNSNVTKVIFNANSQQVGSIDGEGELLRSAFDMLGREEVSVDANGGIVRRQYDAASDLIALTDPVGNTTRWAYDQNGNTIKEVDPLGNVKTWTYNDANQLLTYTDRLGRFREYEYFDSGLLKKETWKTNSGGSTVNVIEYTYNEFGQPLTISDYVGTITESYDDLGRLYTHQDVHGKTLTFGYDDADRVETVSDSFSGVRTHTWDENNLLQVISFDAGTPELAVEYDYNDRNEVTEIRRYTDAARTTLVSRTLYVFDDGGRVEDIHHKNAGGTTVDRFQYTYDDADRVDTLTSHVGPDPSYNYDPTGQVLGDGTETFSFDLNGNRTMSGYSFDVGNRITSDGTWNYTHDDEGNISQKEKISNGELWIYTWDHNNRLTKAEHKPNSASAVDESVAYAYDALGNKVQRSYDADGAGGGSATVEKYAIDPYGNPYADLDAGGSLTMRRFSRDTLDTFFARMGTSGNEDWPLFDHLGSVRDIINASGTVIAHLDFNPFGKLLSSPDADSDRTGFAGFEHDPVTGLGLNGARWYSFDIGMWWSEDPLSFVAGTANLHEYISNDPVNGADPTGLERIENDGATQGSKVYWVVEHFHIGSFPGFQVSRADVNRFEIGVRGFSNEVLLNAAFGGGMVDYDSLQGLANSFYETRGPIGRTAASTQIGIIGLALNQIRRHFTETNLDPTAVDRRSQIHGFVVALTITVTTAVALRMMMAGGAPGSGGRLPLGRGSTANLARGTTLPRNLRESLACRQVVSNPQAGIRLPITMTDPRWPAAEGWVKMQQVVASGGWEGAINVHYVLNTITGEIDDLKIVLAGAR